MALVAFERPHVTDMDKAKHISNVRGCCNGNRSTDSR